MSESMPLHELAIRIPTSKTTAAALVTATQLSVGLIGRLP
jgi:hypothetical protein